MREVPGQAGEEGLHRTTLRFAGRDQRFEEDGVGEPVAEQWSSVCRQLGAAETMQALAWREGFEYWQFPVESPST